MGRMTRIAATGLGLALASSFTSAGSSAEAQTPSYPAPVVRRASAYVAAPRYQVVTPTYRHQDGYFQMLNGSPRAGYTRHYGYSSARRPNETYKPWLNRD